MHLRREGRSLVPLTSQEFKILNSMEQDAERDISRNELLNEVWDVTSLTPVEVSIIYILRLRQKL
jgi:DNA-binding response OmpR family regulator